MINIHVDELDVLIDIYDFILKLVCTKSKSEIIDYATERIANLEKLKETKS